MPRATTDTLANKPSSGKYHIRPADLPTTHQQLDISLLLAGIPTAAGDNRWMQADQPTEMLSRSSTVQCV